MKGITDNGSNISIVQAVDQMEAEQRDLFPLETINLAELKRCTGMSRGKLRQLKKNGLKKAGSTRARKSML